MIRILPEDGPGKAAGISPLCAPEGYVVIEGIRINAVGEPVQIGIDAAVEAGFVAGKDKSKAHVRDDLIIRIAMALLVAIGILHIEPYTHGKILLGKAAVIKGFKEKLRFPFCLQLIHSIAVVVDTHIKAGVFCPVHILLEEAVQVPVPVSQTDDSKCDSGGLDRLPVYMPIVFRYIDSPSHL